MLPEPTLPIKRSEEPNQIFQLLILYRWLSLLPVVAFMIGFRIENEDISWLMRALLVSIIVNAGISLFSNQLNRLLLLHPSLIILDLLFVGLMLAITGGWRSPFYLYALNPILAAALFFQLRGAFTAATIFFPVYGLANYVTFRLTGEVPEWQAMLILTIGFYLIGGTFGYASFLTKRLTQSQELLRKAHQELEVQHDLTKSLHLADNVTEVQKKVVQAVIAELGLPLAVIGLVNDEGRVLTDWLGCKAEDAGNKFLKHSAQISLKGKGGMPAQSIHDKKTIWVPHSPFTSDSPHHKYFNFQQALLLPLLWGDLPVGVLFVDLVEERNTPQVRRFLESISQQAAVSLGMMRYRLRRAQESAIQEERARIAQDIHDTVSQSLFGIVFTLNGSLKLLPEKSEAAIPELEWVLEVADKVRHDIRQTIHDLWPEGMDATNFEKDLRRYTADILQAPGLLIEFDIKGDFSYLGPRVQRTIYRICQECLANVTHHAAANEVRVCLEIDDDRTRLLVRDNGRGFEPAKALAQDWGSEHFGLIGIQQRVRSLGGVCDIFSKQNAGTSIIIDLPVRQSD